MFKTLRLRLVLLYMLVALALIVLIGIGTYRLIGNYFQKTTDLALQHKMVHEFQLLSASVPAELLVADRDWSSLRGDRRLSIPSRSKGAHHPEGVPEETSAPLERDKSSNFYLSAYDGELASIFVLPLNSSGQLLFDPNPFVPPIAPNLAAVMAALENGSDWRTVTTSDGSRVRLLTYRLTREDGPAALQLGRSLSDQDRIMSQLLLGLLGLSGISVVLIGGGSWWLSGRSLRVAQQAWERQQAFIANASHELRTPLTLMRASAEVALRSLPDHDRDNRELIGDVLQECDHMARLTDDLLLLSRLDSGRLKLEQKHVPLTDLLTDIQRQVGRLAAERGINLVVDAVNGVVVGDPARLRQVLLILLDNALRYTPADGTIRVAAEEQNRTFQISVADTGSGIPANHLARIFERFYRVDSARGLGTGGAGLGLSIAKALIEAQRGQIAIESDEGKGTRVTLVMYAA